MQFFTYTNHQTTPWHPLVHVSKLSKVAPLTRCCKNKTKMSVANLPPHKHEWKSRTIDQKSDFISRKRDELGTFNQRFGFVDNQSCMQVLPSPN
jgi:hypothetical protein